MRNSDRVRQVSNEAAYWFIRCSDEKNMGIMARRKFSAWLRQSPENIAELLRIASLDRKVSRQKLLARIVIEAIEESNVVQLHQRPGRARQYEPANASEYTPSMWRRALMSRAGKLVAAGIAAVGVGFAIRLGPATETYMPEKVVQTTGPSESMHRKLHDGSVVHVDARTELKVEYTDDARIVYLYSGQAMFEVKKDSKRKFIVRTPTVDITAVGTKFSVLVDDKVRTVVSEGKVAVTRRGEDARDGGNAAYVTVNQQLEIAIGDLWRLTTLKIEPVTAERKLQWVHGKLSIAGETYGEVAKEFNRRNLVQIHIESPNIASKETGYFVFDLNRPESFAKWAAVEEHAVVLEDKTTKVLRLRRE